MFRVLAVVLAVASACECRDRQVVVDEDRELAKRLEAVAAAKGPAYKPRTKHRKANGAPKYTNRLILETSPYLIQHAHNPVQWHAWGDEAFAKAAREDKPIFLSIGYSTCHWCHVMEEESFEDEAIARELNRYFVPIKVDREERPDLDAVYMAAVRRMTGSGGWPLTVVLLPDRRPVFGGTYFPPRDGTRGVGLATVIDRVRREYAANREGLVRRANVLVAELQRMVPVGGDLPGVAAIGDAAAAFAKSFDETWGGFGRPPKFPRPAVLAMLLRHHRRSGDAAALAQVTRTLERMAAGGIYDQIGGGFHRYAIDDKWRVPHFEKMLYDNAQLAIVYLEASQVTGRADFARVARETLDFMLRDLGERGGFASAIDADSDGREGAFYVWTAAEIDTLVGEDRGRIVREFYDVTIGGNFEHGTNILWRPAPLEDVAARLRLEPTAVSGVIEDAREELIKARSKRNAPHVDRKILVGWNGLAISALARGSLTLDMPAYREAARLAANLVLARQGERIGHSITGGTATGAPFLDDHAYLIAGLLDLFEADPDPRWLREAIALQRSLDATFADPAGGYFFTAANHEQLLVRDKPDSDDALPAGNSIAAHNLLRLYEFTGENLYRERAEALFRSFAGSITRVPTALPTMLSALDFYFDKPKQIVIVSPPGVEPRLLLGRMRDVFVPNRIMLRVVDGDPPLTPLAENKKARDGKPTAYVCIGTHCERPTTNSAEFADQLSKK